MCGRLSCYCAPSKVSEKLEVRLQDCKPPSWEDCSLFEPSANLAPTRFVPILHLGENNEFIIRPMKWGIVLKPEDETDCDHRGRGFSVNLTSPVQGNPKDPQQSIPWDISKINTINVHNVRIETLRNGFFKTLVGTNQTCGILCDGFYEWKGSKPFFFYDASGEFDPPSFDKTWSVDDWIKRGPPLTVLAGVYRSEGHENYSFSVITREATPSVSAIHHRCPIILEDKESIVAWLDRGNSTVEDSLKNLGRIQNENLAYYEVSRRMNKSKYQALDCLIPKSNASGPLDQFFFKVDKSNISASSSSGARSTPKRGVNPSDSSPKKKLAKTSASNPLSKWLVKVEETSPSSSPKIEMSDSE